MGVNEIKANILPTDFVHYMTSDDTCSRCRRAIDEDEVPLRFWPASDTNKMLVYCEACSDEVLMNAKISIYASYLKKIVDYLEEYFDEGPPGHGWQSDPLMALVEELKTLIPKKEEKY